MRKNMLPMNLQLFADPEPSGQNAGGQPEPNGTPAPQAGQQEPPKTPEIDYEKLASVIEGKKVSCRGYRAEELLQEAGIE